MDYTKGVWKVRHLPVTGQPAVYSGDELVAGGVTEDDAQLIASAPDLYEALKGIIALEGEIDYSKRFRKGILKVPANRLNKGIEALVKADKK